LISNKGYEKYHEVNEVHLTVPNTEFCVYSNLYCWRLKFSAVYFFYTRY